MANLLFGNGQTSNAEKAKALFIDDQGFTVADLSNYGKPAWLAGGVDISTAVYPQLGGIEVEHSQLRLVGGVDISTMVRPTLGSIAADYKPAGGDAVYVKSASDLRYLAFGNSGLEIKYDSHHYVDVSSPTSLGYGKESVDRWKRAGIILANSSIDLEKPIVGNYSVDVSKYAGSVVTLGVENAFAGSRISPPKEYLYGNNGLVLGNPTAESIYKHSGLTLGSHEVDLSAYAPSVESLRVVGSDLTFGNSIFNSSNGSGSLLLRSSEVVAGASVIALKPESLMYRHYLEPKPDTTFAESLSTKFVTAIAPTILSSIEYKIDEQLERWATQFRSYFTTLQDETVQAEIKSPDGHVVKLQGSREVVKQLMQDFFFGNVSKQTIQVSHPQTSRPVPYEYLADKEKERIESVKKIIQYSETSNVPLYVACELEGISDAEFRKRRQRYKDYL